MGSIHAMEYANSLDMETGIRIHLTTNHYPPVPSSMVGPCIEAINIANSGESWDTLIELPSPVLWRGQPHAPAHAIIEAHHLEPWLEGDDI